MSRFLQLYLPPLFLFGAHLAVMLLISPMWTPATVVSIEIYAILCGMALSQIVLLALLLAFAPGDLYTRTTLTLGTGILLFAVWRIVPSLQGGAPLGAFPWLLGVLGQILLLGGLLVWLFRVGGWQMRLASPPNDASTWHDPLRGPILATLFGLGSCLALYMLPHPTESDQRVLSPLSPQALGLLAMLAPIVLFPGPGVAGIIAASHRRQTWIAALAFLTPLVAMVATLIVDANDNKHFATLQLPRDYWFYLLTEIALVAWVLGSLAILALGGWRLRYEAPAEPPFRPAVAIVNFFARHAFSLLFISCFFTLTIGEALLPTPGDPLQGLENYRIPTSQVILNTCAGLLSCSMYLLALWGALSRAPLRVRLTWSVALYLGLDYVWLFAHLTQQGGLASGSALIPYVLVGLVEFVGLFALFTLARILLRWRILEPPANAANAAIRERQFTIRDLFLWTVLVALAVWLIRCLPVTPLRSFADVEHAFELNPFWSPLTYFVMTMPIYFVAIATCFHRRFRIAWLMLGLLTWPAVTYLQTDRLVALNPAFNFAYVSRYYAIINFTSWLGMLIFLGLLARGGWRFRRIQPSADSSPQA